MVSLLALSVIVNSGELALAPVQGGDWEVLFDGKSMSAWKAYHGDGTIGKGWQVQNGEMKIVDAGNSGDIITKAKYEWFELMLEFKMEPQQNSGIMFRVEEGGKAPWHSGPEVQIYDHPQQEGVETTGYLYQLYGAKKDVSKPAGQWNKMTIRLAKDKSWTVLNGVKLYEFQYGSDEFWDRVKKSKFSEFPEFARAREGSIGIQGDHGNVSFRNIKIKRLSS